MLGTSASTQALLGMWLQRFGPPLGRWQGRQGHGFANLRAHLSSGQRGGGTSSPAAWDC